MFSRTLEASKKAPADVEDLGSIEGRAFSFELLTVDTRKPDPFGRSFLMLSQLTGQILLAPSDENLQKPASKRFVGRCYILPCRIVVKNDSLRSAPAAAASGSAAASSSSAASAADASRGDAKASRPAEPAAAVAAAPAAAAVPAAGAPGSRARVTRATAAAAAASSSVPYSAGKEGLGLVL